MIEMRCPRALEVGDTILVAWPDWLFRRCTVVHKHEFRADYRVRTMDESAFRLMVRFQDGEDAGLETPIYRGISEMLPVVVKGIIGVDGKNVSARGREAQKTYRAPAASTPGASVGSGPVDTSAAPATP